METPSAPAPPEVLRGRGAVRVLLADDHPLILCGICALLDAEPDMEVVGQARTGSEALSLVGRLRPDIVLLDIRMPGMDGLSCLELLRQRHPAVDVVMLSMYDNPERIESALSKGAAGYVVKTVDPGGLPAALRQVVEKTFYRSVAGGDPDSPGTGAPSAGRFTERELSILRLVARGLSNRAVGRELWVTEQTVKFHLTNIYRKLEVSNRTEAARAAHRLGIADNPFVESA